jgi:DNA-binding response OmpR family regulator
LLDAGADDYLVKPFDLEELVSRIRVVVRRGGSNKGQLLPAAICHSTPAIGMSK